MKEEIYLSVEGLSKKYHEFLAVDNVSFFTRRGEVFSLLGPNGAGKTTVIKMLCGLLKADAGNINIGGISLSADYQLAKTKIGLCPQDIVVWELLTSLEQLKYVGMSYGMSPKEAGKKAENLLKVLGLTEQRNKLAKNLSGGMQRRLNIALALVHDPDIIVLDEPQAGLDPQSRILVRDFIRELAKEKSVILTTHDMDEADRLADRLAIMDHGKILLLDTPDNMKHKLGMGDILQIRIDDISKNRAEIILNSLPPEFTDKKYIDGFLLLEARDIPKLVGVVNQLLKTLDVSIKDMTIRKHTLEDAFISMTGRGMRE